VKLPCLLALDAGTTGNRAILFDSEMRVVHSEYRELRQSFPRPGWVEHDAEEIWEGCRGVLRETLARTDARNVVALGITNQRETVVVWDRRTGKPVGPAIVWQDRRTADFCEELKSRGLEAEIQRKTGLRLDPYFSATKLRWIFERSAPGPDDVAGTVDSWLLWNLTGGKLHATDVSNASRTLLFDLNSGAWDEELCGLFEVPPRVLPRVIASCGSIGETDVAAIGARLPIRSVVGDQQAALFGQGCYRKGEAKCTYGTGLFLVAHAGTAVPASRDLLSTVAWKISDRTEYAVEGSAFVAGSAVQWLRDGLRLIDSSAESERLAAQVPDSGGVFFVPALAGLGAPYWDPNARGLFAGLTRGTSREHLVRAVIESIAFQAKDLVECLRADLSEMPAALRVDGGAASNDLLMQFQADLLGLPVERASFPELTAAGAAGLAGLAAGVFSCAPEFAAKLMPGRVFDPAPDRDPFDEAYGRWKDAVRRSRGAS
jgi:glycerol kinase